MVETTHESLLRQTATAEELLAYFQRQRGELQADIATAQAEYGDLADDLAGVVKTEMATTYYVSPNGSDTNDGKSSDAPFATLGRVCAVTANGANIDVRIISSELEPFVITSCNVKRRRITLRPLNNGDSTYLNWRGSIGVYGGAVNTVYPFSVDYDANEYSGPFFSGGAASISFGGFDGGSVHIKNTASLIIANSVYSYGGLNSIYMGRINFLDGNGAPYAGTTTIFNRGSGAGLAAYELWQCSLGPNFVHAGTPVGSNSYIVG